MLLLLCKEMPPPLLFSHIHKQTHVYTHKYAHKPCHVLPSIPIKDHQSLGEASNSVRQEAREKGGKTADNLLERLYIKIHILF